MNFTHEDGRAQEQGLAFERMIWYQKQVMLTMIAKEKLPQFPYDLNEKDNQQHFRSLHGFLVEELSEFFEAYQLHSMEAFEPDAESDKIVENLVKLNEEFADIMAFALELLLYADITTEDIRSYMKANLAQLNLKELVHEDLLKMIMQSAGCINAMNQSTFQRTEYAILDLSMMYPISSIHEELSLGVIYSATLVERMQSEIFKVLQNYHEALSLFKKKPWRDNGADVNLDAFKPKLINATLSLFLFAQLYRAEPLSIYYQFVNKSIINLERQETNY
jgi:NTP pyrophosphatase (non-canonical NTP hydrolase)